MSVFFDPRVSVSPETGKVFVWRDADGNSVGLMRDASGVWSDDIPTADELKDWFEPLFDREEAARLAKEAVAASKNL